MKLTYRDIDGFTAKKPSVPVVLVYGPDHGLIKERVALLAKHVVGSIDDPFNVSILSGAQITDDPARLIDEASAISMMGGDRLVLIREANDGIAATLKSYLAAPVPGTLVLIESDDLTPKSSLRKLIESEKNAVALPCYVQDAGDLTKLITTTIRAANLRIEPDAAEFLGQAIGGDYQQVKSEIEKLLTYMNVDANGLGNGSTITYDDAIACSGAMGLAAIDAFIDALLLGDTARAMTLFKRLQDDDVQPIMILRGLLAHGRKMVTTHLRLMRGERLDDILAAKDAPVFFKRKAAFTTQMRRWPMPKLQKMMNDIFMAEMKMKSGTDPDAGLPQTLLALSARANKAA